MTQKKAEFIFDVSILVLFFLLVIGTPLIFTSYTRSVFEVNKLLLLRLTSLLTIGLWLWKTLLFKANGIENKLEESYTLFGLNWKKIGLEIPILLWLLTNFISTIFSKNIRLGYIGAYDRWEGIITLIGYVILFYMFAKLIQKRFQLHWLMGGFIVSTAFSAFYGVLQSLGYDFMHWSKDPTYRVFACINNPVHFCPYVSMIVPLGIGYLFYIASQKWGHHRVLHQQHENKGFLILRISILVISLILMKLLLFKETAFQIFAQLSVLLSLGWYICESTLFIQPKKRDVLYWLGYAALVVSLILFKWLPLNKFQWLGFFISMSVFFVLGALPNWPALIKRSLFLSLNLIFYAQLLSFSRATWVAFALVMPMFYLILTHKQSFKSIKTYTWDIVLTFLIAGSFSLLYTFQMAYEGLLPTLLFTIPILLSVAGLYKIFSTSNNLFTESKNIVYLAVILLILVCLFFIKPVSPGDFSTVTIKLLLMACLVWICSFIPNPVKSILERLVLIGAFGLTQFIGSSLTQAFLFFTLIISFYLLSVRGNTKLTSEKKFWLILFMFSFGLVIILPTLSTQISGVVTSYQSFKGIGFFTIFSMGALVSIFYILLLTGNLQKTQKVMVYVCVALLLVGGSGYLIRDFVMNVERNAIKNNSLIATQNILNRTQSYGNQLNSSARISMWKSAIPWFKDHVFFGSGPDTIKFMYPVYRRPEYGKLEGGHNFTPDRLHNEYLNTLVTRGLVGFVIYYIGFILGWYILLYRYLYNHMSNPVSYIIIGSMTATGIYLGQVLFNFGVVATLVLQYMIMGLGLALAHHSDFQIQEETDNDSE